MQFFSKETHLQILGPAGDLEAVVSRPLAQEVDVIGIVCHPHPLYDGTMNNKVVTTIARAFSNLGLWTVRFNYRGVGKSAGKYAQGIGESDDLSAVLHWAQATFPNKKIWLAGFSFGAYVATRVASQEQVSQLVTVAPPVNHFDFTAFNIQSPWLVVQGDLDEVVPAVEVYAWLKNRPVRPCVISMKNASHFFHGQLIELRSRIEEALREQSLD